MSKLKNVKQIGNILEVDGVWYEPIDKRGRDGELIFRKVDKVKYDKLIKSVVNRLVNYLNKKQILTDAIRDLSRVELEDIDTLLKSKKVKPKIKQKQGCIELSVGSKTIQIR